MARRQDFHTQLPTPNGWFAVAWSKDLVKGDVRPLHVFGEDMVLFRSRGGQVRVLDAYCSHLGAHLGEGGRVMGETIRCPFHGWQYDGATGQCVSIPYCDRVPAKAGVRAWEVCEKNGMVFVWHHAEKNPPDWDVPTMPEIGHPDWSDPRTFEMEVAAHVQDTHENNNDPVHFQFVHGMLKTPPTEITYAEDGRSYRIVSEYESETPLGTFPLKLVRDSWGLGLTAVRVEGMPGAGLLMYSSTTPIDEGRTLSRWLLTATNNMIDLAGEEFMRRLTEGVTQDYRIWKTKVHVSKPVFCKADTHLIEYRKWARQFYSNPG
jgi:phenylpropionate dioxygenase-like ring-hydroxylating dioxygenase large terminal subunit